MKSVKPQVAQLGERLQNMEEAGGSNPSLRTIFKHDRLGPGEKTYLERWVLDLGFFTIRLHRWLHSDDLRNPHDHPWWFVTLCLWGRYTDLGSTGIDRVQPGSIRFRKATHRHSVYVESKPCWTLVLTGPEQRQWGFWVDGRFRKRNKYFFEWGHHDPEIPTRRHV